jgi:hypothetical protein
MHFFAVFGVEMILDKVRVSKSTKTASKTPHSRRWGYQCRCWCALASGYDWRSLDGEGNITWTVIANKSRVEKQKKFCTEEWFFLVNFCIVATKKIWRNWENSFEYCEFEKKKHIKWKKSTKFTNHKIDNRRKGKKKTGTEVYMCAP